MRGSSPLIPVLNLAPSSSPMEQFSNGTAPEHLILIFILMHRIFLRPRKVWTGALLPLSGHCSLGPERNLEKS